MNKEQKNVIVKTLGFILIWILSHVLMALLRGDDVMDKFLMSLTSGIIGGFILGVLYYYGFRTVKPKEEKKEENS